MGPPGPAVLQTRRTAGPGTPGQGPRFPASPPPEIRSLQTSPGSVLRSRRLGLGRISSRSFHLLEGDLLLRLRPVGIRPPFGAALPRPMLAGAVANSGFDVVVHAHGNAPGAASTS